MQIGNQKLHIIRWIVNSTSWIGNFVVPAKLTLPVMKLNALICTDYCRWTVSYANTEKISTAQS
ncbi:Uncharacterized protein APZ42_023987 [Daphnia magna]|uniref:Uncharacterized protein n=1 Tax=Daphnia magna TaxID=35525 RepID=A0A0P5PTE8_9CRUS|nr:Uncharacterized protein APZ42_023987 [Daphnia magna]